jgi:hypothetical protein
MPVTREDANLIIALAGLLLAVVATGAAIIAIRRDRVDLRVTGSDAAAGSSGVRVVNVGWRAVRVEQLLMRRWRFGVSKVVPLEAWAVGPPGQLPVVIEPGGEVALYYTTQDYMVFVGKRRSDLLVADAAGRRYRVGAGHRLEVVPIPLPEGMVRGPMPVPPDEDDPG